MPSSQRKREQNLVEAEKKPAKLANEAPDTRNQRLDADREQKRLERQQETSESRNSLMEYYRQHLKRKSDNESPSAQQDLAMIIIKQEQNLVVVEKIGAKRANEASDARNLRLEADESCERKRIKLQQEASESRNRRVEYYRQYLKRKSDNESSPARQDLTKIIIKEEPNLVGIKKKRANEAPGARNRRLKADRERKRLERQQETSESRNRRLEYQRRYLKQKLDNESPPARQRRLGGERERQRKRRSKETPKSAKVKEGAQNKTKTGSNTIASPADCEVRAVIRYLHAKGMRPCDIFREISVVYGNVMTKSSVQNWCKQFREGRTDLHSEKRKWMFLADTGDLIPTPNYGPPSVLKSMEISPVVIKEEVEIEPEIIFGD